MCHLIIGVTTPFSFTLVATANVATAKFYQHSEM